MEFAWEQKQRGKIQNPFVLGAYIHLGRCFDLTDTHNTRQLGDVFPVWSDYITCTDRTMPTNRKGKEGSEDFLLRFRDCALLNWFMTQVDHEMDSGYYYHTVRGIFVEGKLAYDGAGIYTKTHVQIAVRDPLCVLGYFRPKLQLDLQDSREGVNNEYIK